MIKFLRENMIASVMLLVLRLYLGWTWLTGGWHKITGDFDATGFLKGAVAKATGDNPVVASWWGSFLENVALPNSGLFSFLVAWGELLVGLGLLLGCLTTAAVFFGMVMNFAFLFSGTISSNPMMILLSIFVIVAGSNAGRIGLDYYVIPAFRKWWNDNIRRNNKNVVLPS